MRKTVLLPSVRLQLFVAATLALATSSRAQFSSDLETWIGDTVPADWFGVKTNIESDSIAQVSTNPHGGSFAVQLMNRENNTRRFSTQPMAVDSTQSYDVTYWVRGAGEVRISLFDGRQENSGYAPNGPYTTVSGDTWTQLTASVVCDHTNAAGEFIIYVRNTVAPGDVVVDDVNITLGVVEPPVEVSIHQIQYTTDPGGASTYDGDAVITGGIVTGVDTIGGDSYFLQAGSGPWSGVYVYDQSHTVSIGDSIVITATVDEYNSLTEIVNVVQFTLVSSGNPLPAPQLLNTFSAAEEQWEGVLATIADAECTSLPDQYGEWGISQSSGAYLVDDLMYVYAPEIAAHYDITGCIHYANGAWKIEPRFAADIVAATAIEEQLFGNTIISPNPASDVLRVNTGLPAGTRVFHTLTDATGRTVRTGLINGPINVADLSSGLYHLTLRTDAGAKSFPVVIR